MGEDELMELEARLRQMQSLRDLMERYLWPEVSQVAFPIDHAATDRVSEALFELEEAIDNMCSSAARAAGKGSR